jgi:transcriptional regulator with XRE-family HTH domain
MTFGQTIATARKRIGLSQKDLAERILKDDGTPISAQYLNDIERDRRNPPSEEIIAQFARELDLSVDYLHFLAGQWPADLRQGPYTSDQVAAAFKAFRRTLTKEGDDALDD